MIGRPTVMTPNTLDKLREAFLMGCNDKEACIYADIGTSTLYDYEKENEDYSEQKELFKSQPALKAKQTVYKAIESGDVKVSMWYLEKRRRDEFGRSDEVIKENVNIEWQLGQLEKTNYAEFAEKISQQMANDAI